MMRALTICIHFLAVLTMVLASDIANAAEPDSQGYRIGRYDIVWNSPSRDASGVMPVGNGDIAAGVYAIEDDDIYLLLAKNDAYNYEGDIFKTGRVRVTLSPSPFRAGKPFRQVLELATGSIRIDADGVTFRVWADAHHPVYHLQIESPQPIQVTARSDPWRRFDSMPCNSLGSSGLPRPPKKPLPRMCNLLEMANCFGISRSVNAASLRRT
jgi:hypothetical protein